MTKRLKLMALGLSVILLAGCSTVDDLIEKYAPDDEETVETIQGFPSPEGGDNTTTNPLPDYYPYESPPIEEPTKASFLEATNDARAVQQDCGEYGIFPPAPPLQWSDALYSAAYEHSVDMGVVGENSPDISHVGSGGESDWTAQVLELGRGSEFWERVQNNAGDAEGVYASAENAHSSPPTVEIAMEDWIESDGHCANLMNASHTHVGLAVIENGNSAWIYYWTQVFGTKY